MKNLFKAFALTAMIVLSASCIKENNAESVSGLFRTYNLSLAEATKTELSGTGNKRQVLWTEGDEIHYYTVSKQATATNTTVIVNGDNAYVEIPRGRNDEFINAVYGATQLKSSSSTESIMYVSSPVRSEQSYTSFGQAHICAAFSDDIENSKLSFHNVAAILKFTSSTDIHKVVLYGNNNETVSAGSNGDLKITYAGGALTTEAASTGGKTITVETVGAESDFYIAILPIKFSAGCSLDCYDADNTLIFTKKTANAINSVSTSGAPKILNLGSVQDWIANVPPTAVDLGLSVKWATFNVGASRPEEYGDYFAWGETAQKDEYKWANYQFGSSKNGPFSKYVLDAAYGTVDHKTVLDLTDDAAHAAWGDDWRMPTKEEVSELMNSSNCAWTWTTKNGVPGYKVTSRKSGYTDNSIFLPANGMKSGTSLSDAGTMGNYWTSSISAGYPYYAISPFFDLSKTNSDNCYRYFGLGVRPVQGAVVPVSSITIPETLALLIGASQSLSTTVLPENATYKNLTWSSSDETVVFVDANGKVTSIAPGTATITAYSADGGITADCLVSSNQLAESLTLDKTAVEMYVGDEPVILTAIILPEDNTFKSVNWSSSETTVAKVDQEGRVTAVANGTATITATAKDGSGAQATCSVTVYTHVESVSLNKTELTLYNGKSTTLTATVLPSSASNKSVTWTSSDDNVATVTGSGSYATVNGISRGDATITATSDDGEIIASCNVTVKQYVQSITLDKTIITMYVGDNPAFLLATVSPENASDKSLTWTSSKTSVATVDEDGKVTAVSNGTATITAKAKDGSGAKATCFVTVYTHVESISLDITKLTLYNGESASLAATVLPSNASNKSVTWTSSDDNVATVTGSGTSATVKGIARGDAIITVTSVDGEIMAYCNVTVNQYVQTITLDKTSIEMYIGDEPVPLIASILPDNASDKSVTWTSSNTSIATVDKEGKVTAVTNGTTTITATAKDGSGTKATCSVTVFSHVESIYLDKIDLSLYEGYSKTLVATVSPSSAKDKTVEWTSNTPSVATVDPNGKVTGIKAGSATITVTTVDGGYMTTCAVTVIKPDYNGHSYVDLGLPSGLKWATCNVGASTPEECGNYFAWGETSSKSFYNWSTYRWCNGSNHSLTKYNTNSDYGAIDNKTVLERGEKEGETMDDAARANWGGSWRMPTDEEAAELQENCTLTLTTQNGVDGLLITSKTNGNSIFLPAAGYRYNGSLTLNSRGYYWSSSLEPKRMDHARDFFDTVSSAGRCRGHSVRPVSE